MGLLSEDEEVKSLDEPHSHDIHLKEFKQAAEVYITRAVVIAT